MALSDKDIVITPNKSTSSEPRIVFSGADSATTSQNILLQVYPTSGGTISFEGTAGQLLSLNNNTSGTLFSVNDISGLPVLEVTDSSNVIMNRYGGRVGIGTSNPLASRLHILNPTVLSSVPAAGTYGGQVIISNDLISYGLYMGAISSGDCYLQAQRGNTSVTYNLLIQPNGGNVVIGTSTTTTAKLTIIGTAFSPNINLTDAANIDWNTNSGQVATFTFVGANRIMNAPTNLVNGGFYSLQVVQSSVAYTLTWNAVFKWANSSAPVLSTVSGARDFFTFRSDGTNLYEQGRSQGVA